jgi:hypothetical protein
VTAFVGDAGASGVIAESAARCQLKGTKREGAVQVRTPSRLVSFIPNSVLLQHEIGRVGLAAFERQVQVVASGCCRRSPVVDVLVGRAVVPQAAVARGGGLQRVGRITGEIPAGNARIGYGFNRRQRAHVSAVGIRQLPFHWISLSSFAGVDGRRIIDGREETAELVGDKATVGDLERSALAARPPRICRAEQVAVAVGNQAGTQIAAIVPAEVDHGGWGAGVNAIRFGDLEYRAGSGRPACCRCAKQVAVGVHNQAGQRTRSGVARVEVDQDGWGAGVNTIGLWDLEHRTELKIIVEAGVRPATKCCAEQVAISVGDQASLRIRSGVPVEADQDGGGAGVDAIRFSDLEYCAPS